MLRSKVLKEKPTLELDCAHCQSQSKLYLSSCAEDEDEREKELTNTRPSFDCRFRPTDGNF